ncbi:MAG: TonB-dependent receptor [Salinivirgaceae bacterium]
MIKLNLFLLLTVVGYFVQAQYSIYGKVSDANGNPLSGASIQLEPTFLGVVTNLQGQYLIKPVKAGLYNLSVSFLGYEKQSQIIEVNQDAVINFELVPKAFMAEEVIVKSTRAGENAPGTYANISKTDLAKENLGQDLPYLLSLTPSLVATSDAGAGVGYTGFRIRGTDANRINVTVNGIPLNDAESHSVYWVNMPDFASSVENIQVQRGVGTSTNGAAAFGATINMQTNTLREKPYAEVLSSDGSFNTFKNTVMVGSGLLNGHFAVDARLSKITSDGYIDRAFSDLKSFYISGGYYSENTLIKLNVFSGKEQTYQAWNGVPKVRMENDTAGMRRYNEHWLWSGSSQLVNDIKYDEMIHSDSRTYNTYTYNNETDNYQQDNYQLFFSHKINENLNFNSAIHYTYGRGYYEQYRVDDKLSDYKLDTVFIGVDTITNTNLVRQKWLDNDFYGAVASLNYTQGKWDVSVGGGANQYNGRHFGKVIWAQMLGDVEKDYEWYRSTGNKTDWNVYSKANLQISEQLSATADLQLRGISHEIEGIDADLRNITQNHSFKFFNPKVGLNYKTNNQTETYLYYAVGNREPNRSAYTDIDPGQPIPTSERLNDLEAGYLFKEEQFSVGANLYYMLYKNQLVLTGQLNDVGNAIMTNVDKSYRRGIEITAGVQISRWLKWDGNLTLSQNKIIDFTEYVDNWDTWAQDTISIGETNIAFSPNLLANSLFKVTPIKNLTIGINSQYVGKQYIDNSMSNDRSLDAYFVNNLLVNYTLKPKFMHEIGFQLQVNNLLNARYENNAWVYSYIYGGERFAMDGYFPQAGTNFMVGVNLKF